MSTTKQLGNLGESVAADYLSSMGFVIVERNWRSKYCEIDIVARRDQRLYFVEVKSRSTLEQGYGSDYVTSKKLGQMARAAEIWVAAHDWRGEYQLAVVSVDPDGVRLIDDVVV